MDVRTCGINLNCWYVVALSSEVTTRPLGVNLWYLSIVLYRDSSGKVHALEDHCPHRHVKLSTGKVIKNALECAYHGWQFDETGRCISIPYLQDNQKLSSCRIQTYPVQESDGFIWLFPGDKQGLTSQPKQPLKIPEWEHLNYVGTVSSIECRGHFSFLIENLMDMYHGHLHNDYQPWTAAQLIELSRDNHQVKAIYEAQSYYKINKIWSIAQLFIPKFRTLHPEKLTVTYDYPHWRSTLGEDFKIYCLFCPINLTKTRAYLVHFTSLNAFWRLHKLPIQFRRFVKNLFWGSAQKMLDGLVQQDIQMIEQEQRAYLQNKSHKSYEINPTIGQVQKLIKQQVEFSQQNSP